MDSIETIAMLREGINQYKAATGETDCVFVTTQAVFGDIMKAFKDATRAVRCEDVADQPRIFGIPIYVDTKVPADEMILMSRDNYVRIKTEEHVASE